MEAIAGEVWRRSKEPPPPAPPDWLSQAAAGHWRKIVSGKPHDYFIPPNGEFLAFLCSHLAMSDRIWAEINKLDVGDPKQFRRYRALTVMASRESRMISLLMTKLRLLPSKTQAVESKPSQMPWLGAIE
jgi:hypothetical protein